jgi:hypothetical protein
MQVLQISRRNDTSSNVPMGGSDLPDHQSVDRLLLQKKRKLNKAVFGEGLFSNEQPKESAPNAIGDAAPVAKTSMNAELVL